MTEKQGKVRTIHLPKELSPEEEAKKMAAYQRVQARNEAKAAQLQAEREAKRVETAGVDFHALNAEDFADLADTPRRRAREAALLLLYQVQFGACPWELAQNLLEDIQVEGKHAEFALSLAQQAVADSDASDELMAVYAREWDVERFSQVDRAILRLSVSELRRQPQNAVVIINEGVELGKKFGGEDSGSFVNAMLDNIRKHTPGAETVTRDAQNIEQTTGQPEVETSRSEGAEE